MPRGGLADLNITYGEGALLETVAHFLRFMKDESAAMPETRAELNKLLARYLKVCRREQMEYVSKLRVARGESPLPKRLLMD